MRRVGLIIRTAGYVLATTLIAGAVLAYGWTIAWQRSHKLEELILPISLETGTVQTPNFKVAQTADYDVVIDLDRSHLDSNFMKFDVAWEVLDSGVVVARDSGGDFVGLGEIVERRLGQFHSEAGHVYSLNLKVNLRTSSLDDANPVLKVEIPQGLWEGYLMGVGFLRLGAGAIGFVGLLILIGLLAWPTNPAADSIPV